MRKSEFIESINLRWTRRISARNCDYEIKKLQLATNAKAPDYIINNILETASHGIMFGASMSFKTFAVLRLIYSVCTGENFIGHNVFSKGKVLYICGEGTGALSRRIKAITQKLGDFGDNFSVLQNPITIDDQVAMSLVKGSILSINPSLIVYDTFSSLVGNSEENSNTEVARVLRLIKDACGESRTSSLIVHHTGKDNAAGLRGASAFKSNVDYSYEMVRNTDSMIAEMRCIKMKDGENFPDIILKAEVVDIGLKRQDGGNTTSLVLVSTTEKPLVNKTHKPLDLINQALLVDLGIIIRDEGIDCPIEIIKLTPPDGFQRVKVVHLDTFRKHAYARLNVAENSKRGVLQKLVDHNKILFYSNR